MFGKTLASGAVLAAVLCASSAVPAAADVVVLESKGAGIKPRTTLPDSVRLMVPAGASVRILLPAGAGQYVYHTDLLRVLICPPLLAQ